jgi:hypothetical protein
VFPRPAGQFRVQRQDFTVEEGDQPQQRGDLQSVRAVQRHRGQQIILRPEPNLTTPACCLIIQPGRSRGASTLVVRAGE